MGFDPRRRGGGIDRTVRRNATLDRFERWDGPRERSRSEGRLGAEDGSGDLFPADDDLIGSDDDFDVPSFLK